MENRGFLNLQPRQIRKQSRPEFHPEIGLHLAPDLLRIQFPECDSTNPVLLGSFLGLVQNVPGCRGKLFRIFQPPHQHMGFDDYLIRSFSLNASHSSGTGFIESFDRLVNQKLAPPDA